MFRCGEQVRNGESDLPVVFPVAQLWNEHNFKEPLVRNENCAPRKRPSFVASPWYYYEPLTTATD
jgi:hypothetical protein